MDEHTGDAKVTVKLFVSEFPNIVQVNAVIAENPYNLVAAALLRAGLTENIGMLSEGIVIKS